MLGGYQGNDHVSINADRDFSIVFLPHRIDVIHAAGHLAVFPKQVTLKLANILQEFLLLTTAHFYLKRLCHQLRPLPCGPTA